jgi:hypothetical protein
MRRVLLVLVIAACEKTGPVESTPGSAASPIVAPVIERGSASANATVGTDAGVANAPVDAAVVAARPDAAVRRPARDDVTMDIEYAAKIADMLTVDSGRDFGDMSKRRPGADLARQLDDVKGGPRVAIGGGGGGGVRTGTGGGAGSGPKVDAPGTPNAPLGRVTISGKKSFDNTSLTVDQVVMKMQSAYMAGIKRCYKAFLETDPTARGKIKLSISVAESGRSVTPKARGFAAEVDTCLESLMSMWRFPNPKDADGEITDASFEVELYMIPD